jgi:hypothetical protein
MDLTEQQATAASFTCSDACCSSCPKPSLFDDKATTYECRAADSQNQANRLLLYHIGLLAQGTPGSTSLVHSESCYHVCT